MITMLTHMIESLGNNVSMIRQPGSHPMHYMWIDSEFSASQSQGYMLWMVYEWSQALALGHPSRDPRHEEPHKGLIMTTMISLGGSHNTQSHPHVGCAFCMMKFSWWCHNMKTFSTPVSTNIFEGIPLIISVFPSQRAINVELWCFLCH